MERPGRRSAPAGHHLVLLALSALVVASAGWICTSAAMAASDAGPVFGLRPGLAGETTLANGHFDYALPSGGHIADRIEAVNLSSDAITLNMNSTNLLVSKSGAAGPAQPGDPPTGATSWIHLDRSTLVIPPGAVLTDPFTVSVPADTPPGDYLSALVGSLAGGPTTPGGLTIETRVALIVKVTVQGALHPSVSAGPLVHHRSGGIEHFAVTVTNHGNVVVDLAGSMTLPGGRTVPLDPQGLYVIPGGHATLTADWRQLPSLADAKVVAHLTATLDGNRIASITRTTSILFLPWRLLSGAALMVGAISAISLLGRSRLRTWRLRRREERAIIAAHRARSSTSI